MLMFLKIFPPHSPFIKHDRIVPKFKLFLKNREYVYEINHHFLFLLNQKMLLGMSRSKRIFILAKLFRAFFLGGRGKAFQSICLLFKSKAPWGGGVFLNLFLKGTEDLCSGYRCLGGWETEFFCLRTDSNWTESPIGNCGSRRLPWRLGALFSDHIAKSNRRESILPRRLFSPVRPRAKRASLPTAGVGLQAQYPTAKPLGNRGSSCIMFVIHNICERSERVRNLEGGRRPVPKGPSLDGDGRRSRNAHIISATQDHRFKLDMLLLDNIAIIRRGGWAQCSIRA